MRQALLIASTIIATVSFLPYMLDVIRGKVKPRIVTFFTWSLICFISTFAALSAHAYSSAVLTGVSAIVDFSILVLAFRGAEKSFTILDIACQALAIVGIIAWLTTKDPLWAIAFTVFADFIGCIPTYHHAWVKPSEEAWHSFIIFGFASLLSVLSIKSLTFTSAAFPIYFVLSGLSIGLEIMYRQAKILTHHP
ncbi:MAG: hypothetical protein JWO41_857 [Candidatus Saccharibacteria bacterium]|nr:hypothetical protein [Candidatus Saccharibacteria bacterium]